MNIEKTLREYISGVSHMSLGTARDNKPWVCEVHFAFDDDLNLYFRSLASRRHSQDIAANPAVAGNIVEQHALDQRPRGVYFEGQAEMLENVDEQHPAYLALSERLGLGPAVLDDAQQPEGHKFYRITVQNFYLFDARESKPSQKYQLAWKQAD